MSNSGDRSRFPERSRRRGDWLGMQTPAMAFITAHKKTRIPVLIGENASFSEIVGILENARVAGTGFEPVTSRL